MQSAKQAGISMAVSALVLAPFVFVFYLFSKSMSFPANAVATVIFWLLGIVLCICVFYAIWGLWLGFSPEAWKQYCDRDDEVRGKEAQRLKQLGMERDAMFLKEEE